MNKTTLFLLIFCIIKLELNDLKTHNATCIPTVSQSVLKSQLRTDNSSISTVSTGKQPSAPSYDHSKSTTSWQENKKPTNRYTFKCPYCDEQNLTVDALRDHCNSYHKNGKKRVV